MALINCQECQKKISDRAANCPHCGCPLIQSNNAVQQTKKFTHTQIAIISIISVAVLIFGGVMIKNYSDKKAYEESLKYNRSYYSNSSNSYKENYFSQLTITNKKLTNGKINDTVYATVTNNSSDTITGSLKAIIYFNGEIVQSAVLFLPISGLEPNETAVIDGICNTVNGKYDKIEIYESGLRKK